jgi:hypothetical protein
MVQKSSISQSVQRTIVPQFVFKSLYTTNRFDECTGFSCSACEFSALPVVLCWLLMYPVKYNLPCPSPFLWGGGRWNAVVDYRITAHLVANQAKGRQWNCAERISKCWKCPHVHSKVGMGPGEGGGAASYRLFLVDLCVTPYTLYIIHYTPYEISSLCCQLRWL